MFAKRTSAVNYREFLTLVKAKTKNVHVKPYIFFDGHAAHTSTLSRLHCEQLFRPLQNVAYTCELNSVETLFSVLKRNLRKLLLLTTEDLTDAKFRVLVQ